MTLLTVHLPLGLTDLFLAMSQFRKYYLLHVFLKIHCRNKVELFFVFNRVSQATREPLIHQLKASECPIKCPCAQTPGKHESGGALQKDTQIVSFPCQLLLQQQYKSILPTYPLHNSYDYEGD